MGDLIQTLRLGVRTLRSSEQPRHTFAHVVANLLMAAACIGLALLGELRMWGMLVAVLIVSLAVQAFRAFRFMRRQQREVGIKVIEQEEAHTSKCSFLDGESIEHHKSYAGKRVKRGLFRSAKGILINADVQGALNIIKKAIPKAFSKENADEIEDVGLHPLRCTLGGIT